MSMNSCFKCGDVYDTDFQMEMIDGEMVCDRCFEEWEEEQERNNHVHPVFKNILNDQFGG